MKQKAALNLDGMLCYLFSSSTPVLSRLEFALLADIIDAHYASFGEKKNSKSLKKVLASPW